MLCWGAPVRRLNGNAVVGRIVNFPFWRPGLPWVGVPGKRLLAVKNSCNITRDYVAWTVDLEGGGRFSRGKSKGAVRQSRGKSE